MLMVRELDRFHVLSSDNHVLCLPLLVIFSIYFSPCSFLSPRFTFRLAETEIPYVAVALAPRLNLRFNSGWKISNGIDFRTMVFRYIRPKRERMPDILLSYFLVYGHRVSIAHPRASCRWLARTGATCRDLGHSCIVDGSCLGITDWIADTVEALVLVA